MNPNLNPREFGQLGLEGMPAMRPRLPLLPSTNPKHEQGPYPDPSASDPASPLQEEVPDFGPEGGLWDRDSRMAISRTQALRPGSTWDETVVPTWKLKSGQGSVYRPSIDHIKASGSPGPPVRTVKVGDDHHLLDGNHRAMAAKESGRLFLEAKEHDSNP